MSERDDIMSFSGADEEDNTEYTQDDVKREREAAANVLKEEKNNIVKEQSVNAKEFAEIKTYVTQMKKENEDLKSVINELKSGYSNVKTDIDNISLREIVKKVNLEEEEILSNDIYKPYYDKDIIMKELEKNVGAGKLLRPKEQMAILKFDEVVAENAELKKKIGNREKYLTTPIGKISSSFSMPSDPDLADVRNLPDDERDALVRRWQKKQLEKMGIGN